jgi:small-conductance mechanosensitive channel
MHFYRLPAVCAAVFMLCLLCLFAHGQGQVKNKSRRHIRQDSLTQEMNSRISDSILQEAEIKDTTVPFMVNKVEAYSFSLNRSEAFFDRRFDTTDILRSLSGLERGLNNFHNRMERNVVPMNLRNLNTADILLDETKERLNNWLKSLDQYIGQLNAIHQRIREVKHDSTLLNDSLNTVLHGQMAAVHDRSLLLDSILHAVTIKVNAIRNRVSISYLMVKDLESGIADRRQIIREGIWKEEEAPLLFACASDYDASLPSVVSEALSRSLRVIRRFMRTTWDTRSINLLIWCLLQVWFFFTMRSVRKRPAGDNILGNLVFLKKSTLLSSLLLLTTFGPFLYSGAPASYTHIVELLRLIFLSLLLLPFLSPKAKWSWFIVSVIWIVFALDDILLDSAFGERWTLMTGCLVLLGICVMLFRKKIKVFSVLEDSSARQWVILLTTGQLLFSIICNLSGRLTLAKLFAFSAADSLVLAVTLKVCCTVLVDAVYAQSESQQNRFFAFLNFVNLKAKLKRVLWVVAVLVWILAILRNLMLYDTVTEYVTYFIGKKRTIGSVSFSYGSGLLFILIIWVSSVLSQFVSYFFDERHNPGPKKKTRLGSIALLVRIGIWTAGFFIAVAAAGIPISKISILIGALGVGIGFGLQNLVNNLVSGIIIAFERPIQIGDTIEIAGKTGTVQEIGIRSSQINNGEGANIIVPNGDLLSQQLINWTMHNRNKRLKVQISIPYTSDFRKARDLMLEEIQKSDKVMKDPKPAVTVDSFTSTNVNFELKFWVPDMSEVGAVRNEIMLNIVEAFLRNGIKV